MDTGQGETEATEETEAGEERTKDTTSSLGTEAGEAASLLEVKVLISDTTSARTSLSKSKIFSLLKLD